MKNKILSLYIYPIKGMGGIELLSASAKDMGFNYDRLWMVINSDGAFISQRTHPQMALFRPTISSETVTIAYDGSEISFGVNATLPPIITTKVWEDEAVTVEVSKKVNDWISERLGQPVRLVKLASDHSRKHTSSKTLVTYDVSLADAYPYLIIGSASLAELNNKLVNPIQMDRFRPSIVIETQEAHEEDEWIEIQTGNTLFRNVKPCGRCTVITIDQQSALVKKEPLTVLNSYRKSGNSVLFGSYYVCTQLGDVSKGDDVKVKIK